MLIKSSQPLSLLLKASPLVDHLSLYDVVNVKGVAADLSHISSIAVCGRRHVLLGHKAKSSRKSTHIFQKTTV